MQRASGFAKNLYPDVLSLSEHMAIGNVTGQKLNITISF